MPQINLNSPADTYVMHTTKPIYTDYQYVWYGSVNAECFYFYLTIKFASKIHLLTVFLYTIDTFHLLGEWLYKCAWSYSHINCKAVRSICGVTPTFVYIQQVITETVNVPSESVPWSRGHNLGFRWLLSPYSTWWKLVRIPVGGHNFEPLGSDTQYLSQPWANEEVCEMDDIRRKISVKSPSAMVTSIGRPRAFSMSKPCSDPTKSTNQYITVQC